MFPNVECFLVKVCSVGFVTFENSGIQTIFVNFQHFGQIFPSPANGLFLEIVSKRPVSKHFEHGMVVCVVANFLQIVVFTRNAETFLRIGDTRFCNRRNTEENILELVHTCVGEHQSWVTFHHHWSRRHYCMLF